MNTAKTFDFSAFKAYDIRGRVPDQLNEDIAYHLGRAYVYKFSPQRVVVGRDVRLSSEALAQALIHGITEAGADVIDIGLCGTEEVYFQTFHRKASGGIMVTASHNPMDYNGLKLVREQGIPISSDTGLFELRDLIAKDWPTPQWPSVKDIGHTTVSTNKSAYISHLLSYIDNNQLMQAPKKLKLVVNSGNGGAGTIVDLLEPHLPFEFIKIFHEPNGHFPNGIPNPLLPEKRADTANAVQKHNADMGIAWDGDFDRCFFFDEKGRFIEGYYIVGLLAGQMLSKSVGGKVIVDPRLTWNSLAQIADAKGETVISKSGHAFIKETMRRVDAVYGGEMSAHHYFRDFSYCDSGMIPWLLIAELIAQSGKPLSQWVDERIEAFPCSGELNFTVADSQHVLDLIHQQYAPNAVAVDWLDGLSISFTDWRFNVRVSNTEPLMRLNIESRANAQLLAQKTNELTTLIKP